MTDIDQGTTRVPRIAAWILLTALLGATTANAAPSGAVALEGQPVATIVTPPDPGAEIAFAANLLQTYVEKISGAVLPIVSDANQVEGNRILLEVASSLLKDTASSIPNLAAEEYLLHCEGDTLTVVGGSPRGTLHGVCGLLEDHLDVRWYVPGDPLGECVPKKSDIILPPLEDRQSPSFPMRWIGRGSDWSIFNRQNGPAATLDADFKIEPSIYHTQAALLPHREFYPEHPDYFALIDGKRSSDPHAKLCYSNPEVVREVARAMAELLTADPTIDLVSFSPTDGQLWCQCENCRRMDEAGVPKDQSMSRRSLLFYNALAKELRKTHPEAKILVGAYNVYNWPPKDRSLQADPMLAVIITHYEDYCMAHPVPDPHCPLNRRYVELIEQWEQLGCNVLYYEYYNKGNWSGLPWPIIHSIREDMPWYHQRGHVGVYTQFTTTSAWTLFPTYYVAAKLMWNVEADSNAILDEMCHRMFGPAGRPMRRYYQVMETAMARCGKHFPGRGIVAGPWLFTDTVLEEMGMMLEDAQAETEDAVVRQRLAKIGLSYDYTCRFIEFSRALGEAKDAEDAQIRRAATRKALELYQALVDDVVGNPRKWQGIVNGEAALLRPYVATRVRSLKK